MARLIGSQSTSSLVWNPYKMASNDPGHPFSPPAKHHHPHAVSSLPDPVRLVAPKIPDVLSWEAPKSVFEIHSFLGLAEYYRRFIEGFSMISKPMTKLLWKDKKFEWTTKCESSFQELKQRLTTALVLVMPDMGKQFSIYCDASRQGL
jgi:hypothetical protein